MWDKIATNDITDKYFKVICSMYQHIKSCAAVKDIYTDYSPCCIGVRHGENLSLLLFSLFLNDLEETFKMHDCNGINFDETLSDTVLLLY